MLNILLYAICHLCILFGGYTPTSFFTFKIVLAILEPVLFNINFIIRLSMSTKILAGISIRLC